MSYIIAVAQPKGGVGKTTLSVCLAAELRRRGKTVALVDADLQRSACQWAEPGKLQFPVFEIALTERHVLTWHRDINRIAASYYYVVIDTAPNVRVLSALIGVSSLILVPCTPSGLDLEAITRALEIIDATRPHRRGPGLIIVPNRVDARTLEGRQLIDELTGFGETISSAIGNRSAFVRAFSTGRSVAELAGGKVAHREVQVLCNVIEKAFGTSTARQLGHNLIEF